MGHALAIWAGGLLHPQKPSQHLKVTLADETLEAAIDLDDLAEGNLQSRKDYETKEFDAEGEDVFNTGAAGVVTVADCSHNRAYPIVCEYHQLDIGHAMEI